MARMGGESRMSIRRRVAAALVALPAAACAPVGAAITPFAGAPTEDRVLRAAYVRLVSAAPELVEVEATGRLVRIPAPEGFCAPREGVMTGRDSAFFIMERCGETAPGLLSVSVAAAPMTAGDRRAALLGLEAYLRTPEGIRSLGFDAGSGAVFLRETEIRGGTLYVLLDDAGSSGLAFAGRAVARAFTELNGRLSVITLISEASRPVEGGALKKALIGIVERLVAANAPTG